MSHCYLVGLAGVDLVGYEYLGDESLVGARLGLGEPFGDCLEGLPIFDGVDHDHHVGSRVVALDDGVEPLRSGGVPDPHLHVLAADVEVLDREVDPDGRHVFLHEGIVTEPVPDARFAHARVPDQDHPDLLYFGVRRHSLDL